MEVFGLGGLTFVKHQNPYFHVTVSKSQAVASVTRTATACGLPSAWSGRSLTPRPLVRSGTAGTRNYRLVSLSAPRSARARPGPAGEARVRPAELEPGAAARGGLVAGLT